MSYSDSCSENGMHVVAKVHAYPPKSTEGCFAAPGWVLQVVGNRSVGDAKVVVQAMEVQFPTTPLPSEFAPFRPG